MRHHVVKYLHLLGLALFLGSIPGHIVLGMIGPGGEIPDQGVLFARHVVKILTLAVTMPGVVLLVVTGLVMWRSRSASMRWEGRGSERWSAIHLVLGMAILVNGSAFITPAVLSLAEQARVLVETGTLDQIAWTRAKAIEDFAGATNVALALVSMALAVARPRLGGRPRLDSGATHH